jgi:dihydroorotate dehydrogenase
MMNQNIMQQNIIYIEEKPLQLITNASGCWVKTPEQIETVAQILKTVVSKTCTLYPQHENPSPNFIEMGSLSVNCKGMPNLGYSVYRDLWSLYYRQNITYIISMDASDLAEVVIMLQDYDKYINLEKQDTTDKVKELVELNISCPNKAFCGTGIGGGVSSCSGGRGIIVSNTNRLLGYDIKTLEKLLKTLETLNLQNITIGLKMPPYIDRYILQLVGNLLMDYKTVVKYIVCTNSIPNAMVMEPIIYGYPHLSMGVGGISGLPTKLIALANVAQFGAIFAGMIKIIGCGGIVHKTDVIEFLNAGAIGVQVGRFLYLEGIEKLKQINNDLVGELNQDANSNSNSNRNISSKVISKL